MNQGFKRGNKGRTKSPTYPFFELIQRFQEAITNTHPDMTPVFHAWPYGTFIEILRNFRRKELHRTNKGSNLLEDYFSNRDNLRNPIQFRRENQHPAS